jgi:hypothetical protein
VQGEGAVTPDASGTTVVPVEPAAPVAVLVLPAAPVDPAVPLAPLAPPVGGDDVPVLLEPEM